MHFHSFEKMYIEVDHEKRKDRSSTFCLAFILLSITTSTAGQHSFLIRQCKQISCDIQNSVYEKSLASSCALVSFLRAPTDYISIRCNDYSQKYTCSRFTNRFTDISGMSGRVFIDLEHKVPTGRLTYSFSTSYSHGQRVNVTLLHLIRTRQDHFKVVATKTFDCKDADTGGAWKDHCGVDSTDYISSDSEDHYFGFWSGDPDSSLQRYLWLYADTSARTGLHVSESITRPPAQHEVFTVQPVTRAIQWPGPKVFIYFNVLSRRPSCMCDRPPCGNGVCVPHLSSCQCNPGFESSSSSKEECQACPEGKWGLGCANYCTCSSNSVSCRKNTGFCVCHPQYGGARCELNLDICKSLACERTPLKECSLHLKSINCTCKAGRRTNLASGHCDVCPAGSWGPECLHNCSCFRNGTVDNTSCNGVNGSCFCKPDYQGMDCGELRDKRSEPPDACQEPNEHLVTRANLPSLYQCECEPNYQRWNGVCVEFTAELIQVPTNPGLGDTVMFYIIIGLPTDYPSNVSYNLTVNKSYTCIANVWQPGSLDETSWTKRPADFNPRLRNVSYPRAMAKVSWHLSETNTRLQLSTTSPHFFAWNWDVSFNFTGKVGDVLTSTYLVGVDGWLQEDGHNVTKDSVLKVSVAFLQRSGSRVDLIDGEWTTWKMSLAGVECPDFSSLEKVYALMLANSVTEVTVDARFLPKGILRVCNTLVVLESDLLGYHRHFLCGYVRVLPSNSLVAVLHPESPLHLPINQTAELDATESYDPDLDPGEPPSTFKYFWTCTHSDSRDPIPCDDILQVHPSGKGNGATQVLANSLKLAGYYTVTVVVVHGTRRNSTSLIIYPTPGDSLFVTVICTSHRCTDVNVGDSVALEAVCRNCDNHTVFYNWTMSNDDLQNGSLLSEAVENGRTNGKFLVFRPFALKSGTTYKVTIVASIETGRTGKSTYQFSIKESPTGGTCQISPTVGTSLATRFAVNCSGFRSPNQPLEYRVYAKRQGRDKSGFLISYGSESTQKDLVFPAGDERFNNMLEIQVEVADREGGTAYSNLHIRVFPVRVSGTTSLAFVQKTANVLNLVTRFQVLGKTPVQLSNALAIASFIDDNSAADVRGIDISEHSKLREQVLRFIANVRRTDFETHAQEAAIIDRLASGATLSEEVMNYSLKVVDEISSYLQLYVILPRGRILYLAEKLVNALDKLTTVAHAQGTLLMDTVASSISSKQQLSKYSSVFQVVYTKIGTALLKLVRNPDRPLSLSGQSSVVGVIWQKVQPSKLMNLSLQISHQVAADVCIKPSALDIESGSTVKLQMVVHEKNFYMSAAGSERVNMPTILLTLQQHGNVSPVSVTELNEPVDVFITRRHTDLDRKKWMFKNVNLVEPSTKGLMHSVVIHIPASNLYDLLVWLNVPDSAPLVNISVSYRNQKGTEEIVYNDTLWPRPSSSLKICNQFTQDPRLLLLPRRKNSLLKSEGYNVIVKTLLPPSYDRKYDELASLVVTVLTANVTCQALGKNSSSWEGDVCEVGLLTTLDMVHCRCRHLPVISAELSVESYPKDVSKLGFVGVSFNPLLATVVLFLWLTYFIGIYWAYFADITDVGQRGVAILDDNDMQEKYMYLVCTVTGWWHNAGTTARVYIYLNGSETKSRIHQLSDPHRKLFTPGGENWFVLTTPVSIGKVQSVVVFHDNSGPRSDWFLNEVYVQDVQTSDQWHCQYGDWISVNYGPGVLCVELPALSAEKVLRGRRLFHFRRVLTQLIRNEHLWISIFAKSCYSTFTRVQRLTCALCFLLSFAFINLILIDISDKDGLSQGVQEYLSFNLYSILVGFISSLVGIPISVLLVGSFSRISPKPPPGHRSLMDLIQRHATLRPQAGRGAGKVSHLRDWLAKPPSLQHRTSGSDYSFQNCMSWVLAYGEESNLEMSSSELDSQELDLKTDENDVDGCKSVNSSVADRNVTTNALAEKHSMPGFCRAVWQRIYVKVVMIVTGNFTLPWWFLYVSWTFSSLLALVLTFLVLLYGLQIKYQSSFDWLTSFLSACLLIFILQILKLIGNAFFIVFLFKRNAQLEHKNFTYGILRLLLDLKMEELAQSKKLLDGHWRETVYKYPVPQKQVKKMRDALKQDREASKVTRETVMYAIFMVCVTFAAVGEMDIYGAMQTNRLIKFVFANATSGMNTTRLREVDTPASIWTYLDKTLLLGLMATGDGATLGRESFLLCQVRLRQIRQVKQPNDCASHKYTKYLRKPHECLPRFTSFLEDTKSYVESWSVLFDSNIRQAREQKPATFRLPTLKSGTPHSVQFSLVTTGSAPVPENSSSTTDKMPDPFAEKGGSSTIDSINAASPTSLTKNAWTYQTAAELEESGTMAVLDWYPGGGYTVELPRVIEDARDVLNPLQKAAWIDIGTRAIHVHFNVYCPSLDLVSRVSVWFELSPYGRVVTSMPIYTTKLRKSNRSTKDMFVSVCEVGFVLMTCLYTYCEMRHLMEIGPRKYLFLAWSLVEITLLILSLLAVNLYFRRQDLVSSFILSVNKSENKKFISFNAVQSTDELLTTVKAVLFALTIFKIFKLRLLRHTCQVFVITLGIATRGLLCFSLSGIIVLTAFAFYIHPSFFYLDGFKSLTQTMQTLFASSTGIVDYSPLFKTEDVFRPMFVLLFVFFFVILVLCCFVASILEAFRVGRIKVWLINDGKRQGRW